MNGIGQLLNVRRGENQPSKPLGLKFLDLGFDVECAFLKHAPCLSELGGTVFV